MHLGFEMKIYHYLPRVFAIENLKNRRLKISRLNDLNDHFEFGAADHSNEEQRIIWEHWKQQQNEKWGLICFSKTWNNPVLWSHYADRHRGVCLGFKIPDDRVAQVKYTRSRLNINILKLYQ